MIFFYNYDSDMYSKCHSMYFKRTYFCNRHLLHDFSMSTITNYFCHVSFMKMSISCLYGSSELGSLLSIVFIKYFKSDFLEKSWFIKKLKNKNGAINRSSQCNPPILLTKQTFAIFILISVKCNLSSHI